MGLPIKIVYCENIADVDPDKRGLFLGSADVKNQEIRVYDGGPIEYTWQSIFHETLHIMGELTKLQCLSIDSQRKHDELDCLANIMADTLIRNNLLRIE